MEENESSERDRVRSKNKIKGALSLVFALIVVGVLIAFLVVVTKGFVDFVSSTKVVNEATESKEPTILIYDESGSKNISGRIKEYVYYLEGDMKDLGYRVERAVLPAGNMREVDFYIEGRKEYYKANLDRGTGETAEDIVRMIKYLDENGIGEISYVDVRIEGKAYYK